ncbi:MAG: hypothetical protein J7L69_01985, partial [Desulfobulbaceae bacterium]|nr:hypothetical protein [Desulfobulbaceae bacterium]
MTKWLAGITATVIAGVLIFWFTEGFRQPTPPSVAPGNPPSKPSVIGGPITVRCSANPHVLQ